MLHRRLLNGSHSGASLRGLRSAVWVAGLFVLLLASVATAGPEDEAPEADLRTVAVDPNAPIRMAEEGQRSGNEAISGLHGSLARLQAAHARRQANLPAASGVAVELIENGRVLVEVRTAPGSRAMSRVTELGGNRRHRFSNQMFEAWMPIERLDELAAENGVVRVWPARLVQFNEGSVISQGVVAGRADHWHTGGLDGSGVTIAIIDSFNNNSGEVNDLQSSGDWPPDSRLNTVKVGGGSFGGNGVNHGNAVLEIAYDIAPGADFIAYDTTFISDWREAIDQAVINGADIISASLGAPLDGIGDGSAPTGSVAEKVEAAEAAGVVYINSAGNSREEHWGGLYDGSGDSPLEGYEDVHLWASGETINAGNFCYPKDFQATANLSWSDWNVVDHDYDLFLLHYNGTEWNVVDQSTEPQSGATGQEPQEKVQWTVQNTAGGFGCPSDTSPLAVMVGRWDAPTDQNLRLFTNLGQLQYSVAARSLGYPADSPAAISVAALNVTDDSHEDYSSEGPILAPGGELPAGSEEPKPDVASFARVDTVSYGAGAFAGTSASAPHVAGMAALLKQRHPGMTQSDLVSRLEAISATGSNDLGDSGHDFQHGFGRLRFQLENAIVITQQPADVQVNDPIGPVNAEMRDDEGLVVLSGPTTEVDSMVGNDPSGGSAILSGTTTRALNDGLASFDDLSIDTSGIGYTLILDSTGPGPVESDGFDVSGGTPTQVSFDIQPSESRAGQAISPAIVVQVLDSEGNVVTDDNSTQVGLSISAGPGGATLSGGGPVTVSNGEATFAGVSIDLVATGYQLEASDVGASLTPDTSVAFDVLPGDPASLAFSVQPSNADAGQSISPAIVVQVLDSESNLVTDDNSTQVELSIATGPGSATLSGGGPVTVSNGEATFAAVSIDVASTGYQLQASDSGAALSPGTSASFDISPGAPANLAFDVQPSETKVNEVMTPAVTVNVVDSEGNVITDDNTTQVELAAINGPGGASLSGSGPVTVSSGEAVFGSVSLDTVADGYQLEAIDSGGSLATGTSNTFNIIPGDPVSLAFVVQPSDAAVDASLDPAVIVEVLDAGGDRVTWDNSSEIELSLTGGSGGTLSGGSAVTVTDGIAEFGSLSVDLEGTDYLLEAVDNAGALTPANSVLFDIFVDGIFEDRFEEIAP